MTYVWKDNIDDWQAQVLKGTILGGSSLVKAKTCRSCYLSMRGKDGRWVDYKSQELNFLLPQNPYHIEKNGYFRWHSRCSPLLNDYHGMFYKDGKRFVDAEVLNGLRDIGLAVWYLDAGSIKKGRVRIGTTLLGEDGTKTVNQYFMELDLVSEIVVTSVCGGFCVSLDEKSTERFLRVIGGVVPEFMSYCLAEK